MGVMNRIAQALEDYPAPPDQWTAPTAVEELARIRQEIRNADARQKQMSEQAYRAAEMGDGPQAIAWRKKAGEAYLRGVFWREVLRNVTGAQVEAQPQPEEGGDDEEAQLAGYAEQYERSQHNGA